MNPVIAGPGAFAIVDARIVLGERSPG